MLAAKGGLREENGSVSADTIPRRPVVTEPRAVATGSYTQSAVDQFEGERPNRSRCITASGRYRSRFYSEFCRQPTLHSELQPCQLIPGIGERDVGRSFYRTVTSRV
jgi:hypothetical protein